MKPLRDPLELTLGKEVIIYPNGKQISLYTTDNLTDAGLTGLCLYQFVKDAWRNDAELIKYSFPVMMIDNNAMSFNEGWHFSDNTTRKLIKNTKWIENKPTTYYSSFWFRVKYYIKENILN